MNPSHWEYAWTGELVELLTALDRLTKLEPAQAELLASVVDGPLLTREDLADAGTAWGTKTKPVAASTLL